MGRTRAACLGRSRATSSALPESVHLDADETPGLGHHLFQALGGSTPVIGVAKASRPGLTAQFEVMREEEARPLTVTSVGVDIGAAKVRVRARG